MGRKAVEAGEEARGGGAGCKAAQRKRLCNMGDGAGRTAKEAKKVVENTEGSGCVNGRTRVGK